MCGKCGSLEEPPHADAHLWQAFFPPLHANNAKLLYAISALQLRKPTLHQCHANLSIAQSRGKQNQSPRGKHCNRKQHRTAGSADVPVTKRKSLARLSSPISRTTVQKFIIDDCVALYPERYSTFAFQSDMSIVCGHEKIDNSISRFRNTVRATLRFSAMDPKSGG